MYNIQAKHGHNTSFAILNISRKLLGAAWALLMQLSGLMPQSTASEIHLEALQYCLLLHVQPHDLSSTAHFKMPYGLSDEAYMTQPKQAKCPPVTKGRCEVLKLAHQAQEG